MPRIAPLTYFIGSTFHHFGGYHYFRPMFLRQLQIISISILALSLVTSCNEYQKVLKDAELKPKYDLAERYYEEGDYKRALRLFEQIAPKYVGKPQGERVMFFFADCYYKTEQYYLGGFQFERFVRSYPNSDKIIEATFLEAKCYFLNSPEYSLDQSETDKALAKLQVFINRYPDSEYFVEANEMAQTLTHKKERKAFEIAKQFDKLGEFNFPILVSSIKAFNNFLSENPGSIFTEEAYFYRLNSEMHLAQNSTIGKQEERYKEARGYLNDLKKAYPNHRYQKEVEKFEKIIDQFFKVENIENIFK